MLHCQAGHAADARAGLPLALHYCRPDEVRRLVAGGGAHVLGEIHFGDWLRDLDGARHPCVRVGMAQLDAPPRIELWTSAKPVAYDRVGDIGLAAGDELLFGSVSLDPPGEPDFERAVEAQYAAILALIEARGYPNLLRMWNYFPGITAVSASLDRYQHFCRGRYQALAGHFGDFEGRLPAASAVGSGDGPLTIYFIAARTPGMHRENPRQMSAYRYPPQYGPRSPSFARATLKRFPQGACLFVSGTASIVGHESRHPDDPAAQLEETLRNLRALIDDTARDTGARFDGLAGISHLKIYLRDPAFLPLVRAGLDAVIAPNVPRLTLRADICRTDLLLEIEALVAETP
jgi:chorismate lyase / 3-hydroxybenzoate synthase